MPEEPLTPPLKVIPTISKADVSKDLSFPIGAEALSRGLEGVPQFDSLKIQFVGQKEQRRQLSAGQRPGEALRLVTVEYRRRPLNISTGTDLRAGGRNDDLWTLLVSPVARRNRYDIKQLLVSEGLQIIREWLSLPRSDTWRYGTHSLIIEVDVDEKSLLFSEENQ